MPWRGYFLDHVPYKTLLERRVTEMTIVLRLFTLTNIFSSRISPEWRLKRVQLEDQPGSDLYPHLKFYNHEIRVVAFLPDNAVLYQG